ncbi:class I SAM-dependent methyltransferase [Bacillus marinisedimentorum]|uniref:class I SAM-dependent methyltransferase n=1 Tax=Bacillus marinisedimentorum TaxID=1821260 RepID=UPI0007E1A911|nr:class I SAM-dependent methyltransferase [Bacillus marinisedimentorum]
MDNWHKEAQSQWNSRAGYWDENAVKMWSEGSRRDIIPLFKRHVKPSGETNVLDIGCGPGHSTTLLQQAGYSPVGIDLSAEMIEKAKNRDNGDNLTFLQADVMQLPFKSGEFDAVTVINVLEWTASPLKALAEIRRVLKPGGTGLFGILGPTAGPRQNSFNRLSGESVICNTMMPWEFKQLAEENGWNFTAGKGVYKKEVKPEHIRGLPEDLQQALTFMWLFILEKK